ncbi:MAG: 3-hydroxyacyl-CoA dehydrogenase NAD-binding domain-containing protein [Spirochaetales bacterium]|nr:3-hydroxyacyl-CoA dehydrogenase NAD-binding domain-containing protein [Spirochaetales bacterium]
MSTTATNNTTTDHSHGAGATEYFHLAIEDRIATLTFDSPGEKLNTFTKDALLELERRFGELERLVGEREVSAVIFASAKEGNFIAGADIKLIEALEDEGAAREAASAGQALFNRVQDLPVPTVAAINGSCVGGGLELALSCDYRIAASDPRTKIGLPETQLGILPGWGGTFRLPRIVGRVQATKMILAGSTVDADRALKIGLVDAVYPPAFFAEWGRALAARIVRAGGDGGVERSRAKARARRTWFLERTAFGRGMVFRAAAKDVRRRTGGHYPAQPAALAVLRRTAGGGINNRRRRARALRIEAAAFGTLAVTEVCKNLVRLFFSREATKRQEATAHGRGDFRVRRAAVLGAGIMGGRIAWLFSNNDIPTVMKDINWEAVHRGYQSAKEVYDYLKSRRKLDDRRVNLKLNHIHGAVDYAAVGMPDLVVEAVVERIDVKKRVLAEVERSVSEQAIIVSNTSALSIDEMAESLSHPERFAGMHFFNPVNRMPLVEVIRGESTSAEVVGDVVNLTLALGKTPVVVKNSPGFLVNRLLLPYLNEAAVMLGEGVDYATADRIFTRFGMPMGPYTLLDEVGIDVAFHVAETLHRAFGERMATAEILDAVRSDTSILGKKSGAGFYLYRGGKRGEPNPAMKTLLRNRADRSRGVPSERDILDRAMLNMVNEAAYALDERIVASPRELDLAMIMGTGFPPFRGGLLRWADTIGLQAVRDRLAELADGVGPRFEPAPLLARLADEGRGFYD